MRRMMVRIANELAQQVYASVLITGESVGQVASQTLSSMIRIDEVSDSMILRPLITYDKEEIVELAKQLGTYELSILPFDDCCSVFTPEHPITNPLKEKTERFESFGDYQDAIDDAIANTKYYKVTKHKIVEEQK
jgi:tRNA uracil 4-sulfurtransferase